MAVFTIFQNFFKTKNMDTNDGFDGKPIHLNCFYMHTIFEQKYLKLAIVIRCGRVMADNIAYAKFRKNLLTPPRTPRISRLKSQIMKPTFLS